MKIKWSLDINTGAVERSEAARARRLCRLAGATVVGDDVIASTGYMKKQPRLGRLWAGVNKRTYISRHMTYGVFYIYLVHLYDDILFKFLAI